MITRNIILVVVGAAALVTWLVMSRHPSGKKVTAEQFGDDWPLTIPVAYISCEGPFATVVRAPDGKAYALTSVAENYMQLPQILPIRKPDPKFEGLYISRFPLIQAALKLCK